MRRVAPAHLPKQMHSASRTLEMSLSEVQRKRMLGNTNSSRMWVEQVPPQSLKVKRRLTRRCSIIWIRGRQQRRKIWTLFLEPSLNLKISASIIRELILQAESEVVKMWIIANRCWSSKLSTSSSRLRSSDKSLAQRIQLAHPHEPRWHSSHTLHLCKCQWTTQIR